jgi:DNA transposition AAA+ family ATPase
MWRNISSQVGGNLTGWEIVNTKTFEAIMFAMKNAKEEKSTTWVVGDSGCGKTTAARTFLKENKETFVILCSEDMKKSDFIREMAHQIGICTNGLNIRDMLNDVISKLAVMREPLVVFDEGDKLTDTVFTYYISLYNRLEDKTGMIFLSTSYIKNRMMNGLRYNKKGYQEIYSRIGRKFFELDANEATDVYSICRANGISDPKVIGDIVKEVERYEFDLRRVKKAIGVAKKRAA